MQIAIDGHIASGKGTIAKSLSEKLGFLYLDTGSVYRKLALFSLTLENPSLIVDYLNNIEIENIEGDIRSLEVSSAASKIAILEEVRNFVTNYAKKYAEGKSIIMDGRDIATVIMPNADFKFFVTASLDERAKRRFLELSEKGETHTLEEVKKSIEERDERDSKREIAPLKPTEDSIIIDNTNMDKEECLQFILAIINKKL